MRNLIVGFVGALCLAFALAARFTDLFHGRPLDLAHLAGGFGAGLLVAAVAERLSDRPDRARPDGASRAARQAGGALEGGGVYQAHGSTCSTCGRPLLPGVVACPFCNPVVPAASRLEGTVCAEHEPLEELVPMPGLAIAAKQTRQAGARGYLHVFTGANKGESMLLGKGAVTIGRAPDNTLVLKDEGVSQKHAEVRLLRNEFYVKDFDSRNGTFVNDERVKERRLVAGDVIAVGATKMLFQG